MHVKTTPELTETQPMKAITPVDLAKRKSELATTPKESFVNESEWKAAEAWAKEQRNYELVIQAFRGWIDQRRLTTELIAPAISQGRPKKGSDDGTILGDLGFTKSQWHRRKLELDVLDADINTYLDECIEMTKLPTLYGLLRDAGVIEKYTPAAKVCPNCGHELR